MNRRVAALARRGRPILGARPLTRRPELSPSRTYSRSAARPGRSSFAPDMVADIGDAKAATTP
jgi:hypothetical protein